ncbi:nucleoside-diphosphate-sugar epimerase [Pseudoduganella flava]|uniref:NAD-dependent epimerase/dehydratase family protein n=1 Tax=Pseudoduganella flava TaxID=871742 RepID=A0A562PGN8_9BURK|nr:SDR family oxidoreductase [Pseudoduganella flava]QGZ40349.1 NAD-dependent epimerase/dehydratase family protein [Pseudoduganella flava]TWI43538.1 nucleoside-diphosphate-sugar epimerase [Pseudoduganella flava]
MLILLTGSTGFLGSRLLPLLRAQGHRVLCAGRRAHGDCEFVQADFAHDSEKSAWVARLSGVDAVINTVGIIREVPGQTFARLHTETPRALFAACVEAGVGRVIQVSALGADAAAETEYHLSKKAADDYLATLPIRSRIVQPSLIYGPEGTSARMFRTLATMPFAVQFGAAPQPVQPIHVEDVCAAIVALLAEEGGPRSARVPLVGPAPLPFIDYLAALRRALGLGKLRTLRLPSSFARAMAAVGGLVPGSPLTPDTLRMLTRGNTADPADTIRLLGRPPRAVDKFVTDPQAERREAQLGWLLPLLRVSLAIVWIWTAYVSAFVYPVQDSYVLLERTGIPAVLAPLMLYGASALDLAFGIGTLALPARLRRWLWLAQVALIGFYTVVIALRLPEFLWHPYGPLSKNLPMLAAIWLLYELEKHPEKT